MARGNTIVVSSAPDGKFTEGYINGTGIKPGTLMERDNSIDIENGRFTYRRYQPGTDGEQRQILILMEDYLQGRTVSDAYEDGDRIQMYTPRPGDEVNVLVDDITGTADDIEVGDRFMIDTETGRLVATTGSPESEPFEANEAVTDPTADHLVWCTYTGY